MIELPELLKARDDAIARSEAAAVALAEAERAAEAATLAVSQAAEASLAAQQGVADAHQAIHDLLAERGHVSLRSQRDGTVTLYHAINEPPGYGAYHPVAIDVE